MSELDPRRDYQRHVEPGPSRDRQLGFRHVMACVDDSPLAQRVLAHAAAIAEIMGARLTLMRVIEPVAPGHAPLDAVEWHLSRCNAEAQLAHLAAEVAEAEDVELAVVGGSAADSICHWACEHEVDLTVLGTHGEGGASEWGLGGTVRLVAESVVGSVMIVPESPITEERGAVRYHRLMVPLDGSPHAECVLPTAIRIAEAHKAELLLVHAVPEVALTEIGPLDVSDLELRDKVRRRNERVAEQYMNRVRARLPMTGMPTRTRLLPTREPRHALARAISEEGADFVVLSASGRSGHPDLPIGSTADFLINHAMAPILLVRGESTPRRALRRRTAIVRSPKLPGETPS